MAARDLRADLVNAVLGGFAGVERLLSPHHLGRAVGSVRVARDRRAVIVAGDLVPFDAETLDRSSPLIAPIAVARFNPRHYEFPST
jgi:hypothetical protein